MLTKPALRRELRTRRLEHAAAIPDGVRGLLFMRPPAPLLDLVPQDATVAVYNAVPGEASPLGWAKWLHENGRRIALPWFASRAAPMLFREWANPWDDDALEAAPYGGAQPPVGAAELVPDVAIIPVLGFTATGARLGQGGGHYDRFLADHPATVPIGIAWDCQLVDALPAEPHDVPLRAVVTPTRFYGPF